MTASNGTTPDLLAALPIQPTGSGVADLEIAYEQMQLQAAEDATTTPEIPTEGGADAAESAAHPS